MPESIPIAERIERQVLANVAAIDGLHGAYRWDSRAADKYVNLDAIIAPDDETVITGAQGSIGVVIKTLPLIVLVKLVIDESSTENPSWTRRRWQAKLEQALTADEHLTETGTSERLAVDMRITAISGPELTEGLISAAVRLEIEYQHDRNDPYVGPGITEQTE